VPTRKATLAALSATAVVVGLAIPATAAIRGEDNPARADDDGS
jgi:hypothetical protein